MIPKLLPVLFLAAAAAAGERPLRVGLFAAARSVTVGPGAVRVEALPGGNLGAKVWNAQVSVRAEGKGLKIGGERYARKVRVSSAKEGSFVLVDGRPYRGVIELSVKDGGRVLVVNELDVEDYLRGVVPGEMPHSWPLEALKCQAVVARSYAEANRGRFGKDGYDICATAACQVYQGVRAEKPSSDRAVEETRGLTVAYKGEPVSAVFHSSCGGRTDAAKDVWRGGGTPYLQGVRSRWCRGRSPHDRWSVRISEDAMAGRLRKAGKDVGRVKSIRVVSRTPGGRAYEVRVTGTEGALTLQANAFRLAVGGSQLRSTLWTGVSKSGGEWRFDGKGWGHGVGLCQWCSNAAAAQGYKFREILAYFYRRTKVRKLDDASA